MMKLVNMLDLGSSAARLVGSSPTTRTRKRDSQWPSLFLVRLRLLPQAKSGRYGWLIEIVQEKSAKVFPAHTLFLAKSGSASQKSILTAYCSSNGPTQSEQVLRLASLGGAISWRKSCAPMAPHL